MNFTYFPLPRGPLAPATGVQGGWRITSYFGGRIDPITGRPGNHGGQDMAGPGVDGQPLYAVADGYVSQGWDPGGGGNWTTLYLDNGGRVGYGHASSYAPGVNGKRVAAGTVLAYVGTTGKSTGSHLHFAFDSEDANTYYDDPFDVLQECSNRFVGSTPVTTPASPPPGGLTVAEYEDIMGALARLEKTMGTNLSLEAQWEQETRLVTINGTEAKLANRITEAGWSSRSYPFKVAGKPDVWHLVPTADGRLVRRHIKGDGEFDVLTKVLLNPHVVELPAEAEDLLNRHYPIVD